MAEESDLNKMKDKYVEHLMMLAMEASQVMNTALNAMEAASRDMYASVSKEGKVHSEHVKSIMGEMVNDMKKDTPVIQQHLKDLETKVNKHLSDLQRELEKL